MREQVNFLVESEIVRHVKSYGRFIVAGVNCKAKRANYGIIKDGNLYFAGRLEKREDGDYRIAGRTSSHFRAMDAAFMAEAMFEREHGGR